MSYNLDTDIRSRLNTLVIHGGISTDETTGAVSVPIYQTSTYKQVELGVTKGYEYSRTGNPTRQALEALITDLEAGSAGFAFASGMAAITAVILLFKSKDKILISSNVYGGTFRVLDKIFKNFGVDYKIVDTTNLKEVENSIDKNVKAFIIETPANPLLSITDIKAVSDIARSRGVLTIVDNTFMTPYLQQPLKLGADIVVHSATKYLGGHSDVVAGLVVVNNDELAERLHFIQNATGGILEPFDSWLLMRGIKTLAVRLDRHVENARIVADFLKEHKGVKKIYYPGFEDFDGFAVHNKQASAPGAMISFILSDEYDIKEFFRNVKLITLAESLGGVESLISHPASMTHASIPYEIRQKVGIVDKLIRLSVGIEDKQDIINDLKTAFAKAKIMRSDI
jgi:cystathionine beta-lyase